MEIYNALAIIIVLASIFGYINFRFLKFPNTIGVMMISLLFSLVIILLGKFYPALFSHSILFIHSIDFYTLLMKIMLSFLLFAGSIHINLHDIKSQRTAIFAFSTIGVLISTLMVAGLLFLTCYLFHLSIDILSCLLFGALISPTDPIAVMGILKKANIPKTLETKITGESLFNDGVAVVLFTSIYEIIQVGLQNISVPAMMMLFLKETGGGILLGWLLGYAGYWALKTIDNYKVEVMITLSVVMGGYLLADNLHVSGPLAMVVAGIIIGNKGRHLGMSDITRDYVDKFWEMTDEILNAILFLLIGLEMLVIRFTLTYLWMGLIGFLIVLTARFISMLLPISILKRKRPFEKNAITILTWGGLRGGISVALALSLAKSSNGELFIAITYIIVLFSIVLQGLTIGKVAKKLV